MADSSTRTSLRRHDSQAKPFVKWAGGKRSIIPEMEARDLLPRQAINGQYYEPLVGGGALYFWLNPSVAHLNDANPILMAAYKAIRDEAPDLVDTLESLEKEFLSKNSDQRQSFYYDKRDEFNDEVDALRSQSTGDHTETIAKFLFLNKTCYNGLYRVNQSGEFNVPMGSYENPNICDRENLLLVSELLEGTDLTCGDYATITEKVGLGDFIYCDPPYTDPEGTASFRSYTAGGFDWQEQERLAKNAKAWDEQGARVLLSNHLTERIRTLYEDLGFQIEPVEAPRYINSDGDNRDAVEEALIYNYEPTG